MGVDCKNKMLGFAIFSVMLGFLIDTANKGLG